MMRLKAAVSLLVGFVLMTPFAHAGLIGSNFQISLPGKYSRFVDMAFDTTNNKYLVVYTDYNATPTARACGRFVSAAGVPLGTEICFSDATGGLFPAVAYNPVCNLFLVTWDDQRSPFPIWGQLASGTTETLVGTNFQIGSAGGIRSAVAASTTDNNFLVVWQGTALHVFGQRVSNLGTLLGTNVNISNVAGWYPAVAYASSGNQYLVTWDEEAGVIHGQRFDAANSNLLGGQIAITSWFVSDRSAITYDSINSRWMVVANDTSNPGNSYDQTGQLVSTTGALIGGEIPFASSSEFEGDTNFGGDISFLSSSGGRYFASFAMDSGAGGQEALASGLPINSRITVDPGNITSSSNAADPANNRWLLVWEEDVSGTYTIFGRLFEASDLTPPGPITNFLATPGSGQITLNWTNPSDADFTGTMLRYKLGSFPAHVNDGTLLSDESNTPASNDSYVHMGLTGGVTYYYAAFAHDGVPNYSSGATISGLPAAKGDFDVDTDVDQKDFGHLQNCFSGSLVPYAAGCSNADLDADGDVDGADFLIFDGCMRGPNQTPGC